jgi:phage-related protein
MLTSLSPYQLAFNDYVVGSGTNHIVESIDGLEALPPLRVQDDNRGYIDGSYSGRDFYDGRTVTVQILTIGDSSHSAHYYYRQLQAKWVPQQLGYPEKLTPFQFQMDSAAPFMLMYGRVRSNETIVDPEYTYGYIQSTFTLYFPDPRYYNYTLNTSSVSSSATTITNNGWAYTCPVITISSPSSAFAITELTDGGSTSNVMAFTNVNTSQNIVIDLLQRTITQNGTNSRNTLYQITGEWISVQPSAISYTTLSLNTGTMSVAWRDAYI